MRFEKKSMRKLPEGRRVAFYLTQPSVDDLDAIAGKWTEGNRSAAIRQMIEDQVGRDLSQQRESRQRAPRARVRALRAKRR